MMKPSPLSRSFPLIALLLCCAAVEGQIHFRQYNPGGYYDLSGTKHTGFIDFGNDFFGAIKINFKKDTISAANQKIDLGEIRSLIVMRKADVSNSQAPENRNENGTPDKNYSGLRPEMVVDSFVVVKQTMDNANPAITINRLCTFVTDGVNSKIYSRMVKKSAGGFGMGLGSFGPVIFAAGASFSYMDTVYLCEADGSVQQIRRSNYKQILTKAFADYPELAQKIQNKILRYAELDNMIKTYVAHKTF